MEISSANLDALRVDFSAIFAKAYSEAPVFYDKMSSDIESDAADNVYGWIAQQLAMRKWVGPRVAQNLKEHDYRLHNDLYEATIELLRTKIEDDTLGIFRGQTMPQLAVAAKKHPDKLLAALITANPNGFDGVPLFSGSHPTFAPSDAAQTYSNDFALALTSDNFQTVYAAMASYVGEDGMPLEVGPTALIVPPQLRAIATAIMHSSTYAIPGASGGLSATIDNPLRGWCEVIEVKQFAAAPTVWYVADLSQPVKPFIHQIRDQAQMVARDNPQDPKVFDLDMFTYGTRLRDAMGISLPFLIARSTAP